MHLDIRTIIFITAVIQALYAAGLLLISRAWIKSPLMHMLAVAFLCGAIGDFLLALRGSISPFLSIVVANVFVLSNPVLILEGVSRFRGIRSRIRVLGPVLLVLVVPLLWYATFVEPDLSARIVVMSVFFGLQTVLCAFFLLRGIDSTIRLPAYTTAFFFLFASGVMALRVCTVLLQPQVLDFMASGTNQSYLQLAHILYISGVTFSFIWLNCRKLSLSLEDALHNVEGGIQNQFNFIDVLSHELKTPLATIQNSVESLVMRCGDIEPAGEKAFERIQRSLERLNHLIETGLKQKYFLSEQIRKKMAPLSIVELLQTAIMLCKGAFPDQSVKLVYNSSYSGQDVILGDANTLLTALMNVMENAMKFNTSTREISVEIGQSAHMLTVAVKDRGCGVDPADSERVFEKFYRAGHGDTVPGSGIGLFLARHIIGLHSGTITMQNRQPTGCRIDICLPFSRDSISEYVKE